MAYSRQNKTMLPSLHIMWSLPRGKIIHIIIHILIVKQMIRDFRNMPAPKRKTTLSKFRIAALRKRNRPDEDIACETD